MKNKTNKKRRGTKGFIFLALLLLLVITACQLETANTAATEVENSLDNKLAYIKAMGYSTEGYVIKDDSIIVEGDIVFTANHFPKDFSPGKAYKYNGLYVSSSRISNVRVRCLTSGDNAVPAAWRTAVSEAVRQWNLLEGTRINFSIVSTGGDIIVSRENISEPSDPKPRVAEAPAPSGANGAPGSYIKIDDSYDYYSAGTKRCVIAHELGHTIGFAHNNGTSEITTTTFITGSINGETDSIMTPSTHEWNTGFSGGDIIGAQQLYRPTGAYVEVFQNTNYGGRRYIIEYDRPANRAELQKVNLDNQISSIKVFNGARVRLCADSNYGGYNYYVRGNISNLGSYNFNDITTSVTWKVPSNDDKYIILYTDKNYQGRPATIWQNCADLSVFSMNNRASSISFHGDVLVQLFDQAKYGYGGKTIILGANKPDLLEYSFNDIASSITIF